MIITVKMTNLRESFQKKGSLCDRYLVILKSKTNQLIIFTLKLKHYRPKLQIDMYKTVYNLDTYIKYPNKINKKT